MMVAGEPFVTIDLTEMTLPSYVVLWDINQGLSTQVWLQQDQEQSGWIM